MYPDSYCLKSRCIPNSVNIVVERHPNKNAKMIPGTETRNFGPVSTNGGISSQDSFWTWLYLMEYGRIVWYCDQLNSCCFNLVLQSWKMDKGIRVPTCCFRMMRMLEGRAKRRMNLLKTARWRRRWPWRLISIGSARPLVLSEARFSGLLESGSIVKQVIIHAGSSSSGSEFRAKPSYMVIRD